MALPGTAGVDVLLGEGQQGAGGGIPSLPAAELLQEPGAAQTLSPCWGPAEVTLPRLSPAAGAAGQEHRGARLAQRCPHCASDRTWDGGLSMNTTSESLPRQLPVLPHKNLLQQPDLCLQLHHVRAAGYVPPQPWEGQGERLQSWLVCLEEERDRDISLVTAERQREESQVDFCNEAAKSEKQIN